MNVSGLRSKLKTSASLEPGQIPSPIVANLLSRQSFDWITLDLEHVLDSIIIKLVIFLA